MSTIGSGLDINGIVSNLISIDRNQRITPLQVRQVGLNAKLSLYGQIKSAFSKFEDTARDVLKKFESYQTAYTSTEKKTITNNGNGTVSIRTPGNGLGEFVAVKSTTNSAPGVASLTTNPDYGVYNINVLNLNQSQQTRINTGSTDQNTVFGGGTLNIAFASGRNEVINFAQQQNRNDPDIDPSAQDVVNGINAANVGLTATFDSTTGDIVIESSLPGAQNAFTLSTENEVNQRMMGFNPAFGPNDGNDNNNSGFSRLSNGVISRIAKDVTVSIDNGTTGSTFSNVNGQFNELGINFTALSIGSARIETFDRQDPNPDYVAPIIENRAVMAGDPAPGETRVLTGPSTSELTGSINTFISEYNSLVARLKKSQLKGDELDRDTTPFRLEAKLRDIFNQVVGGTETKADIGFSISKEGVLSVDRDKLAEKLLNDPDSFERIFSDSIAKDFADYSRRVNSDGGAVEAKLASLNRMVGDLRKKETKEFDRLGVLEKQYRNTFIALDKALTDLQASQSFLTSGLAQLQAQFGSR